MIFLTNHLKLNKTANNSHIYILCVFLSKLTQTAPHTRLVVIFFC